MGMDHLYIYMEIYVHSTLPVEMRKENSERITGSEMSKSSSVYNMYTY